MRKLFVVIAVAAMSCSRESAMEEMSAAKTETATASTARTAAAPSVEGTWRLKETRYNRGDGNHYWQEMVPQQQYVVIFQDGKLIGGNHPFLSQYVSYSIPRPGTLHLSGSNGSTDVLFTESAGVLELTYRLREEVVDRFMKQ